MRISVVTYVKWQQALVVDSTYDYKIQFEQVKSDRWLISKMDGNDGIPTGYTA